VFAKVAIPEKTSILANPVCVKCNIMFGAEEKEFNKEVILQGVSKDT